MNAIKLRGIIRRFVMNPKNYQKGTYRGAISEFLENLLDIRHQETFSHTRHNNYIQGEKNMDGYNIPLWKN